MKKILTFLLIIYVSVLNGTTYYISTTGSNSNNGSIGSPWQSLSYACSQVITAGDIIHVNSGTYTESSRCNLAVGVSIEGVGDASYIISTYYLADQNYGAISLYSTTAGTDGSQSISYIKLDGSGFTSYSGITVRYRSNVEIHHCTILNFQTSGISFRSNQVTSTLINAGSDPDPYEVGNKVHHCTITDCTDRSISYSGLIKHDGQDGLLVYDNILNANGKATGETGNCISAWGGHDKNVKYYRNIMRKPVVDPLTWNFCMELGSLRGGIEIYDNEFYNGVAVNISGYQNDKGSSTYSAWIHDNYITNDRRINYSTDAPYHRYFGITLENGCNDMIVNNNYIKNLPYGISCFLSNSTAVTFTNIHIYNNIIENIGYGDGNWSFCNNIRTAMSGNTIDNIYWENNTITLNGAMAAFVIDSYYNINTIYIRNNIIKNIVTGTGYGWLTFWETTGTIENIYAYNNLLYNNPNSNNPYYRSGKTVSNYVESGTVKSDPLFISSTDFNLQSISPAIGVGYYTGLTTDYLYNSRSNPPDIGAYEYVAPVILKSGKIISGYKHISNGYGKRIGQ